MKNNVQSIERAFQILQAVHGRMQGLGIQELAEEAQLHTSTTSRIVATLEQLGALERKNGKLFIGEKIVTLANHAPWSEQLISMATPSLRELSLGLEEAVGLTLIEGNQEVVCYQIPSSHHIQVRDWTGEHFPLHVTSTGKLYLAGLEEAEQQRFFQKPLEKRASKSKTTLHAFQQELAKIQQEGVAWTCDELEDGLTSVAAPIFNAQKELVAGLYVSLPNYRVHEKEKLVEPICEAATTISKQLGYGTSPQT